MTAERREGHSALVMKDGVLHVVDPHPPTQESVILLELFEPGVNARSANIYWAGRGNQITRNHLGVEVTFNVHKARRIPTEHRDLAEALAEALNDGPERTPDTLFRVWRAVEHGFYYDGPVHAG